MAVLDSGRWPTDRPETVPGIVRADLADAVAQQVAVMLVENDADQRTLLTVTERAAGYGQLVAFDLDAAEIGRRVGKSAAHVESALRLGRMNATVQAHADAGRLSLEDVAELAEFDDDPKVQARILKDAGSPWGIRHRMADERRRRADKKAEQDLRVELAEAGVAVVVKPKGWPFECAAARAMDLKDPATGESLDPDAVRADERFAAFIDTQCSPKLDRLSRLLVARWIAGQEDNLAMIAQNGPGWRRNPHGGLAWLARLTAAGYELSDAETQLRDDIVALIADEG